MKPLYESIPQKTDESLHVHIAEHLKFETPLHYHDEFELLYIKRSSGTRIVENCIESYFKSDFVLIGSNVPHVWKNEADDQTAIAYVIHFKNDFGGGFLQNLPELIGIRSLLNKSQHGIQFIGLLEKEVEARFSAIINANPQGRMIQFLSLLDWLSNHRKTKLLNEIASSNKLGLHDCERINQIINYLMENYNKDINYKDLASLSHMELASLCRYFKKRTNKNITQVLNEIRISKASKLIAQTQIPINRICAESGFNNYGHFNEKFKEITGFSPLQYRQKSNTV